MPEPYVPPPPHQIELNRVDAKKCSSKTANIYERNMYVYE